jgi:hypothetical protein
MRRSCSAILATTAAVSTTGGIIDHQDLEILLGPPLHRGDRRCHMLLCVVAAAMITDASH